MTDNSLLDFVDHDVFYEYVLENLDDPNEMDIEGRTLLHIASWSVHENPKILKLLLDRGSLVNSTTSKGYTPLHLAARGRNRPAVVDLIEAGASVNPRDILGRTPLHFAITRRWRYPPGSLRNRACDIWIVEKLLCHPDIDLNPVDEVGETPLMWAVKERNSTAVKTLLKKGADPNIPDEDSRTPLHVVFSARNRSNKIVDLLLKHGADIYHEDKFRQTPMDVLIQTVGDDETLAFASKCVSLIAMRYHIRESLTSKLERFPVLFNQLEECCREARLMRKVIIHGKFTLHDFALNCFQAPSDIPMREIYKKVVEVLLTGLFRKYFGCIFNKISFTELTEVLKAIVEIRYPFDLLPRDSTKSTVFDSFELIYEEKFELRCHLRRYKELLMTEI